VEALQSKKRFVVLALPTGVGKTLVGTTYALFEGEESAYLTATKGQQDQVRADFESAGFVDVRGMSNYTCLEDRRGGDCSKGKCMAGEDCIRRMTDCHYFTAVRKAQMSKFKLTNYAFWLMDGDRIQEDNRPGKGPRLTAKILICDEAHLIGEELSRHLTVTIREGETKKFHHDMGTWPLVEVVRWAKDEQKGIEATAKQGGLSVSDIIVLRGLWRRLAAVSRILDGKWVVEEGRRDKSNRRSWDFKPVLPEKYAGKLWRDAEKILLVSATIRPKALEMLGLGKTDYDFLEYPSPLPMHRRPIIHLQWKGRPTRMSYKATPKVNQDWLDKIDAIIDVHRSWGKGIIHSVSYERAKLLRENSAFHRDMILNDSWSTRDVLKEFKDGAAPLILVSPSVGTGYDFPFDAARWQIIAKMPFPPPTKVIQERSRIDKDYRNYVTLTDVVQMAGRVMRDEDDYGITYIVDDQIAWLLWKHGEYVPRWFMSAYSRKATIPRPKDIR
jgi:Rad3-related DNA helicase